MAIKDEPVLATTMIYDETDLDLMAPVYWVSGGSLQAEKLRKK